MRIFKGRLPPLIHAASCSRPRSTNSGRPRDVKVVRGPSHAPDVTAAVREMTFRVDPLPLLQPARFTDAASPRSGWSHKNGRFQLDALTEGQD